MTLRSFAEMRDEDRAQAARRLLDDPYAMGILAVIEQEAIAKMLTAGNEQEWRELRDTVVTARKFRDALFRDINTQKEAVRPLPYRV